MITQTEFLEDVLTGLSQQRKTLPCKYFYDQKGSRHFEDICNCPEYYITRTEMAIMSGAINEIAGIVGPQRLIVEYGTGSAVKTGFLLKHLKQPAAYVPIDIFSDYLERTAHEFAYKFPELEVLPVCADFTRPFELPQPGVDYSGKLLYFPGSTIGNFSPPQAEDMLRQMFSLCRSGDHALIGVDLQKPWHVLHNAYNDHAGHTAAFNLNLLERINRELGADFELENFVHRAFYNEEQSRVEMHLVSLRQQIVTIDGQSFGFDAGESIHTESCYKYGLQEIEGLGGSCGFLTQRIWMDQEQYFAVVLLEAR
jgi:dimethylhistidine N-methyltransferase